MGSESQGFLKLFPNICYEKGGIASRLRKGDGDGGSLTDSDCAGNGADAGKAVRKHAASTEPVWQDCGQKAGVEIWRIEDFQVKKWPKAKRGRFHRGDSYIVLNTTADPRTGMLLHDIYFWLGQENAADEMGTAACKAVELGEFFGGKPVQHREVVGNESQAFLSLFPASTARKAASRQVPGRDRPPSSWRRSSKLQAAGGATWGTFLAGPRGRS